MRHLLPLLLFIAFSPAALALAPADQVAAGYEFSAVLREDGAVWTWGRNDFGQLGDGTTQSRWQPAPVPGLFGVKAISAGESSTLALLQDGTLRAWGANHNGELGLQRYGDFVPSPVAVPGIDGVIAIDSGVGHHLALRQDGVVWGWGLNDNGQLGNGTSGNLVLAPYPVQNLSDVTAIAAGGWFSLALRGDGTVWTWGANSDGQLGIGLFEASLPNSPLPVRVHQLTEVVAIAAGAYHALALRRDGTVWAWGLNWIGQLGDNTDQNRNKPVRIPGLSDILAIGAGEEFSFAIAADGRLWAWGDNYYGQLANGGGETEYFVPTPVLGVGGIQAIEGGWGHTLALQQGGLVFTWGLNWYGQMGIDNGSYLEWVPPVAMFPLADTPASCEGRILTNRHYASGERITVSCSALILTAGSVQIQAGAEVTLRAPQVVLRPGFQALAGARLQISPP